MSADPVLRKIELDSLDDLRYLYDNIIKTARDKIEAHFHDVVGAAGGPGEVVLGRHQWAEVQRGYINRTFELASPNISINGIDTNKLSNPNGQDVNSQPLPATNTASGSQPASIIDLLNAPVEEFEPYDRTLHSRVQSLYSEIENTTLKVARQRREVPHKAARKYEKLLERELRESDKVVEGIIKEGEELRKSRGLVHSAATRSDGDGDVEMGGTGEESKGELMNLGGQKTEGWERKDEMKRDWNRSMVLMEELKKSVPATAHRLQRAKDALEYAEAKMEREAGSGTTSETRVKGRGRKSG
ncbi:hypothetical protein BDZ91DRAFT_743285 [Kalaharituber pfeilii]|nr:hypothetical protein BDZ91DRAFT_743285 [Kalaharituber pfeilii]